MAPTLAVLGLFGQTILQKTDRNGEKHLCSILRTSISEPGIDMLKMVHRFGTLYNSLKIFPVIFQNF